MHENEIDWFARCFAYRLLLETDVVRLCDLVERVRAAMPEATDLEAMGASMTAMACIERRRVDELIVDAFEMGFPPCLLSLLRWRLDRPAQ